MYKIQDQTILQTLNKLHSESAQEFPKIMKGLSKGIFRKLRPEDMKDAYIAISPSQGAFIYNLLIEKKAKNIIEFGTSFGISTLYLGAAARANEGKAITTEILPEKCKVALENFEQAGLSDYIELREGDAMETLKETPSPIDFLLLDGWNDLYLPLLKLLEPRFKTGILIYIDNASFRSAMPLMDYFRSNPDLYKSVGNFADKGGASLVEFVG